ncbi:AGAP009845-PA, partial [Anopheles gambiae str. PEST]
VQCRLRCLLLSPFALVLLPVRAVLFINLNQILCNNKEVCVSVRASCAKTGIFLSCQRAQCVCAKGRNKHKQRIARDTNRLPILPTIPKKCF